MSAAVATNLEQNLTPSAVWLFNLCGCRMLSLDGIVVAAIWRDLDCVELRAALKATVEGMPIVYLETAGVPEEYKTRCCPLRDRGESFQVWLRRAERKAAKRWAEWERQCLA